jgi:hypothetical protein
MDGTRSKIPNKNLVVQHCAEEFNSGVKELSYLMLEVLCVVKFWLWAKWSGTEFGS